MKPADNVSAKVRKSFP